MVWGNMEIKSGSITEDSYFDCLYIKKKVEQKQVT